MLRSRELLFISTKEVTDQVSSLMKDCSDLQVYFFGDDEGLGLEGAIGMKFTTSR